MRYALTIICFFLLVACKQKNSYLFTPVSKNESGISFANKIIETEDFNIIEYLYFYNGSGVSIGDINNDGLSDIYFVSNQAENKLYLNKGHFKFEDITERAGVAGLGNWKTGVTFADVNGDGFLDIYVCGVGNYKKFQGFNQLYINNGDLTFTDRATEYGLFFQGLSTQANFFDYDLDGDLDMYLLNHSVHSQRTYGNASLRLLKDSLAGDRLYKNNLIETGKPFFVNVTEEAGILSSHIGYGLGVGVADLNQDGYPDIYVSNDFSENDYLYINEQGKKFKIQSLSHYSRFSMGNDLADINNDERVDIFTTDMLAADEAVIKSSAGEDSYEIYSFKLDYGYERQVSRNALQINQGVSSTGNILFSDVALYSNVFATDWSWSPLLADFDGDGLKDLFITNGIVRRPNDLNYINYISSDSIQRIMQRTVLPMINKMPKGDVQNYFFRNRGDLKFTNESSTWVEPQKNTTTGAAYGDLDNDGDLDLVTNVVNNVALVYRNNSDKQFISIQLEGDSKSKNHFAIGSTVTLYSNKSNQVQQVFPTRGWCSSSDLKLAFAIDTAFQYDSMVVKWPDKTHTTLTSFPKKGSMYIRYDSVVRIKDFNDKVDSPLFSDPLNLIKHTENRYSAFTNERLMPHMATTEGPRTTIGDVNSDGLEDFFLCGARNKPGVICLQDVNGNFKKTYNLQLALDSAFEDVDAAFFDADNDKDLDLVVVSGGHEEMYNQVSARLYINDGSGHFDRDFKFLPFRSFNASCVKPYDFDQDGDADLFIGANLLLNRYGLSPDSYLVVNHGNGNFVAQENWYDSFSKEKLGMVKDAIWTDVNNDALIDLIVVGEWMPITILLQQPNHLFWNATEKFGLNQTTGWWNRIEAADMDGDGDFDFVIGNLGLNSRLKASKDQPLDLYVGDFDANGSTEQLLTYFNNGVQYPFNSRDQLIKQVPSWKKKFPDYTAYQNAQLNDILNSEQIKKSKRLSVNILESVVVKNEKGKLIYYSLPYEAQLFPIKAIHFDDADGDGNVDLLIGGNLLATQPDFGPYDAGVGLFLKGNNRGDFAAVNPIKSGFIAKGEIRDIKKIHQKGQKRAYLVSRNNDTLLLFNSRMKSK